LFRHFDSLVPLYESSILKRQRQAKNTQNSKPVLYCYEANIAVTVSGVIIKAKHIEMRFIMKLGPTELMIILAIVIVLFGVGRLSRIGGELGEAIGNFRKGIKATSEDETGEKEA
jgi:TatA/E family protein of Tat protein translocase